ncbi:MAG: DNA (cytosine-5-)-methyltransferase [Bacteroidales bacterium]|nr:DNA (cytosine-5-)-methyltransferase [Bacteroidales bacterium]
MNSLKFLDFFAGIGGFRRGLEMAGHKCVGFCEWDKYATASYISMHCITDKQRAYLATLDLKKRQKEILKDEYRNGEWYADDIRGVCARDLPGGVQLYCFGAPCQDFSVAGKRAGLGGERSILVQEIFRLLEEQEEESRPEWLIYENVKGMFSSNHGLDYLSILSELDELGYDVEWQNINSAWFVPQNRERIYTVGHLRRYGSAKIFPISPTDGENRVSIIGHRNGYRRNTQTFSPDGITEAMDTGAGGGRGHYVAEPCFCDLTYGSGLSVTGKARCIQSRYNKGASSHNGEVSGVAIPVLTHEFEAHDEAVALGIVDTQGRSGKEVSPSDTVPTLRAQTHGNVPEVVEQVDTETDKHEPIYIQFENGVTAYAVWYEKYQCYITIRKLTPKECFRLQGWDDEYFERAAFVNSDSQLYKQAGNGVTVNVVYEIGKRLAEAGE